MTRLLKSCTVGLFLLMAGTSLSMALGIETPPGTPLATNPTTVLVADDYDDDRRPWWHFDHDDRDNDSDDDDNGDDYDDGDDD